MCDGKGDSMTSVVLTSDKIQRIDSTIREQIDGEKTERERAS